DLVLRLAVRFRAVFLDAPAFVYRRHAASASADRTRLREAAIRLGEKLVAAHPEVLPLLGARAFRRRQARRWARLARGCAEAGDVAGARAALARACALRPGSIRYRLEALLLALRGGGCGSPSSTGGSPAAAPRRISAAWQRASSPAGIACTCSPHSRARRRRACTSSACRSCVPGASRGGFDVVVGFGRTLKQDVVRVGGGTHRTYLARMEAAGLRGRLRGPYHRAILWIERRQFAPDGHRRVLAVSARVRDEVVADYGVEPARIQVIYNGVDLVRFDPARRAALGAPLRAALGVPPGARVCAAIGTGFARKGFDLLLALWHDDPPPDTMLLVVGDDERLAGYRRRAARPPL